MRVLPTPSFTEHHRAVPNGQPGRGRGDHLRVPAHYLSV
ncbi:hypothetical protein KPATCC21470_6139 [Kitasatospora purpeofusca]